MAITDKAINGKPGTVDVWLRESLGRGCGVFEARITPAGARTIYFRYTGSDGQRVRLLVGAYSKDGTGGGLTLATARAKASEWSLLYQSGVRDLREHFEQQRADEEAARAAERARVEAERQAANMAASRRLSVRELFERWQAVELAPRVSADGKRAGRKDGGAYIDAMFRARVFDVIGDMPAADVRKADVMAILDKARSDGKLRTANVLLANLRQLFRFALVREIIERNPLDTVTRRDAGGAENMRDRVLTAAEVRALVKALPAANLNKRSAAAVWLMLATGCRVSEAMGARWDHVDLDRCTWYLPETKNGRDHTIHLSSFALRQFKALQAARENDKDDKPVPWVFPNVANDGPVDVTTFGKQLADRQRTPDRQLKNRTKATGALTLAGGRWTSHDLRRTAATMMAELGVSGDVIDECLNHVIENRVRRTYIRDRRMADQKRAFEALGARLDALVTGKAADTNIVPLASAAA